MNNPKKLATKKAHKTQDENKQNKKIQLYVSWLYPSLGFRCESPCLRDMESLWR